MRLTSLTRLLLLALLWGSGFLMLDLALKGFSAVQITFLRLVLGAVALTIVVRSRGLSFPRDPSTWGHFAVAALIANALPYWLFAIGQPQVGTSVAGAINATTPLWALLFAVVAKSESFSVQRVLGLVVGLGGTLILLAPWDAVSSASTSGALICLVASASYGLSYVYIDRYLIPRDLSPLVLSAGQLTAASVLLLLVMPFAGRDPIHPTPLSVAALLALGVLSTGLAYVLNYRIITEDGPTIASSVTYLIPIVAISLGAVFLHEATSWHLVVGTTIVLTGIVLLRRGSGGPNRPATKSRAASGDAS